MCGGGGGEALAPLMEGPDPEGDCGGGGDALARQEGWGRWVRGQLQPARAPSTAGAAVEAMSAVRRREGGKG
ncbi:hypothetical protein ACP4OV_008058 [Aristida adscensionis]